MNIDELDQSRNREMGVVRPIKGVWSRAKKR